MLPHEQLEHNAQSVASPGEHFAYCLRCKQFVNLDYLDACMRCGGRDIIWREIDPVLPKPNGIFERIWRWLRE